MGDPAAGAGEPGRPEVDWFGRPLAAPRAPVPCPRCGEAFIDAGAFRRHLRERHDASADVGERPVRRREAAALGRRPRSPFQRRLAEVSLVFVVAINLAVAFAAWAALDAASPAWWVELRSETWARLLVVPALAPTALVVLLRDDL